MSESNKSYRIRTVVGQDTSLTVNLNQSYDVFEVLSIKLKQEDTYKLHSSNYGVIVGRVLANEGFGVPNAKVSIFIKGEYDANTNTDVASIYPYQTTSSQNSDGVPYNLLPDNQVDDCHQIVGTFPNKTYMLDNDVLIEVFDGYYKYTTRTNNSGDYMICGVPTGQQTLHMDLDLSDCGILSQRPRDFVYKGYTIEQFENPNQFKTGTELNSLSQIFRQDTVVNVIPFWGNEELGETIGITRADIKVNFKFEPTCVFMGSLVADNASNGISKKCVPTNQLGAMDELTTGEGTIEMIRKTPGGDVEEFQIKGTQLIDGNGVWCYQIPMNLDYMMTDEYGNMVPTDDPTKGIPTRARVRFRISMNDTEDNTDNYFRAKVLVPHNPQNYFENNKLKHEDYDYEFGTYTKDESYRDLFWNNVYTVKSYIPRFQKSRVSKTERFTGIKHCNIYGQNNPMPYNNIRIKLPLIFTILCVLIKTYIWVSGIVNSVISALGNGLADIGNTDLYDFLRELPLVGGLIPSNKHEYIFIKLYEAAINFRLNVLSEGLCPDLDNWYFAPVRPNNLWKIKEEQAIPKGYPAYDILEQTFDYLIGVEKTGPYSTKKVNTNSIDKNSIDEQNKPTGENVCLTINTDYLISCVEMALAQEYKVINFDFYNDWVNGVIYMPRWMRFVRNKRTYLFGLIKIKPKIKACMDDSSVFGKTRFYTQQCALTYGKANGKYTKITNHNGCMNSTNSKKQNCHKNRGLRRYSIFGSGDKRNAKGNGGVVHEKQTMQNEYVYYFKPCEWRATNGKKVNLFANDVVLLGSLNDCNLYGIPQAFKYLTSSSYIMPTNLALTNMDDDGYLYADGTGTICGSNRNINKNDSGASISQLDVNFEATQNYYSTSQDENVSYGSSEENTVLNYDDTIPITEAAGIAWNYTGPGQGAPSKDITKSIYYPGGHFLGISCINSQTNIKSCINLQRICEAGATESQRREEVRSVDYNDNTNEATILYKYFIPTGLIAQDEINAPNFRSMFATMNHKRLLCTNTFDEKTGYPIYDFMFMKPIGFDGVLNDRILKSAEYNADIEVDDESEFMKEHGVTLSNDYDEKESIQTKARTIEETSDDYYMFRLGLSSLNDEEQISKYLFDQSGTVSMPQYENSYYFYFGLKDGATALDEFNKQFFSTCANKTLFESVPNILTAQTFNPCTLELDVTVMVENMDNVPVSITIKNVNTDFTQTVANIVNIPISCTFENLSIGEYEITATDVDGQSVTKTIQVGNNVILLDTNVEDFDFKTKLITNPTDIISSGKSLNCGYISVGTEVSYQNTTDIINTDCYLVLVDKNYDYVTSNGSFPSSTVRSKIAYDLGIENLGHFRTYPSFENGKFYVWFADSEYNLFIVRNCEGTDYATYYQTFTVNGCDNYDLYLGSKFLPYSTKLKNLVFSMEDKWFDHIGGSTKDNWAMRHALFRQTDDDSQTFRNNLIALGDNGKEIDTVLFGQPDYLDGDDNYRYYGYKQYYEGDNDKFEGDLSDESIIPTWPSGYTIDTYAQSGQGSKLHYGEMAANEGLIISDKVGEYNVTISQNGDRIQILGIDVSYNIVPNGYGCIVRLNDETLVYPVRDGGVFYYYGEAPENETQTVTLYPLFFYPVMYRPFYAKQYTIDWPVGQILIEGDTPTATFDSDSWKTYIDIYNGITYEGKFSIGETSVNGISGSSIISFTESQYKNDLYITGSAPGQFIVEGYHNIRPFSAQTLTNPNSDGYSTEAFGYVIKEGCPQDLTEEEEKLLNTPYELNLEVIEGNIENNFPTLIRYKYDWNHDIMFTADRNSSDITYYLYTGTSEQCPIFRSNNIVYRESNGWNNGNFILCRYNISAHTLSSKNEVGKAVAVSVDSCQTGTPITAKVPLWVNIDTLLKLPDYREYAEELKNYAGQEREVSLETKIVFQRNSGMLLLTNQSKENLQKLGVDIVNTHNPNNYNAKEIKEYFFDRAEDEIGFKKISGMKIPVEGVTGLTKNSYIFAVKKTTVGQRGEINVAKIFTYDMIREIEPYTPPSSPKIELYPSGTTGIYSPSPSNSGSTFVSEGGNLEIKVKTYPNDLAWKFSFSSDTNDTSWIKVNGASEYCGAGPETLIITADEYMEETLDRTISGIVKTEMTYINEEGMSIPYSGHVEFIQLRKQRKNYIEPETTTVFTNGGEQLGIKITSNINEGWKLKLTNMTPGPDPDEDWARFVGHEETREILGTGSTIIYLLADINEGQEPRYVTVTIEGQGGDGAEPPGARGSIKFTQGASMTELVVSPLSLNFSKTGGTQYVTVQCNGGWEIAQSPGSGWLTLTKLDGKIKVDAVSNEESTQGDNSRQATITITSNGEVRSVAVYQSDGSNKYINASLSSTAVTFVGGSITLSVVANTDWIVQRDNYNTWVHFPNGLDYVSGTTDMDITCTIDRNTTTTRTCSFTVGSLLNECVPVPETIVLKQGESSYSFKVISTIPSNSFVSTGLTLMLSNGETLEYEEVVVNGAPPTSFKMFDTQYSCIGYSVKTPPQMQGFVDRIRFMGYTASKNSYGNYVISGVNFTVQQDATYTIEEG